MAPLDTRGQGSVSQLMGKFLADLLLAINQFYTEVLNHRPIGVIGDFQLSDERQTVQD